MTEQTAREILTAIRQHSDNGYGYFGVRSCDAARMTGRHLSPSHEHDTENGRAYSTKYLSGSSATRIDVDSDDEDSIEAIMDAVEYNAQYAYEHQYIVAGTGCGEWAEDDREIVINDHDHMRRGALAIYQIN